MGIKRIGVVGSGIMGAGVAEVAAKAGLRGGAAQPHPRTVPTRCSPGSSSRSAARSRRAGSSDADRDEVLGRVRAVTDLGELAECDLVHRVDRRGPRHEAGALHASSTACARRRRSSPPTRRRCPSSRWRWAPSRPERVCGIHFFNPAPADVAGRDRARDHHVRRHARRGPRRSSRRAARPRSR